MLNSQINAAELFHVDRAYSTGIPSSTAEKRQKRRKEKDLKEMTETSKGPYNKRDIICNQMRTENENNDHK